MAESLITARYQTFSQVYFHKTRRAYDFMLGQFLKETIKKLPPPTKLDQFLELDDYAVWHMMRNKKDSYWAASILNRNHLRKIHETKEIPEQQDVEKIAKIKNQLGSKQLWYCEDLADKVWYDLSKDELGKEIMVVPDKRIASPLSGYSRIVEGLNESRQIRIYVKPQDREIAKTILQEGD